ncbi:unnamed protein product [Bubo scandiacus]
MGWLDGGGHGSTGVGWPPHHPWRSPPLPVTDLELEFRYRTAARSRLSPSATPTAAACSTAACGPRASGWNSSGRWRWSRSPSRPPTPSPTRSSDFTPSSSWRCWTGGSSWSCRGRIFTPFASASAKFSGRGPAPPPGPAPTPSRGRRGRSSSASRGFSMASSCSRRGRAPPPPRFEIFLCFGEEWPDQKPKEKKLIMVQVVPVAARLLLEIFSGELSWSADSVPLQISPPDLKDKMVEQFKELHQLWQNQQRLPTAQPQLVAANGGPWVLPPPRSSGSESAGRAGSPRAVPPARGPGSRDALERVKTLGHDELC